MRQGKSTAAKAPYPPSPPPPLTSKWSLKELQAHIEAERGEAAWQGVWLQVGPCSGRRWCWQGAVDMGLHLCPCGGRQGRNVKGKGCMGEHMLLSVRLP